MAPADRFIITHRRKILAAAVIVAIIGGALSTQLRFDFDPLDLKDPKSESVSTLFDLMQDPNFGGYTIGNPAALAGQRAERWPTASSNCRKSIMR